MAAASDSQLFCPAAQSRYSAALIGRWAGRGPACTSMTIASATRETMVSRPATSLEYQDLPTGRVCPAGFESAHLTSLQRPSAALQPFFLLNLSELRSLATPASPPVPSAGCSLSIAGCTPLRPARLFARNSCAAVRPVNLCISYSYTTQVLTFKLPAFLSCR
ncbi:hypothetical protein OH76DRAFT_507747 [Lentinus brumalis]|uniref:Uncharacterized protein n=1 Tax=Lentinus brumalis TaxID=2498619 RepID=A0A371DB59_9APHY|nr:hypothetical protein OH76DRAFT_507747 [Polyporus brumalis]